MSLAGLDTVTEGDGTFGFAGVVLAHGKQLKAEKDGYAQYIRSVSAPRGAETVVLSDILLQRGDGPLVAQISPKYEGIFLAGIPIQNTYRATINWNDSTPGSVRFFANGKLLQAIGGVGPDYDCEVDMNSAFVPAFRADANWLEVVAITEENLESAPTRIPVFVIPQPPALWLLTMVADPTDDDVDIHVDFSFPDPGYKAVLNLPVFGKFGTEIAANGSFDYTVRDGDWQLAFGVGAEGQQGKRGRRPKIPGLTRSPKIKLYIGNKEISGTLTGGALGTATPAGGIVFDKTFGHGEIGAKLELGRVGLPDLLGPGLSTALRTIPGIDGLLKTVTVLIYVVPGIEGGATYTLQPVFAFSEAEFAGTVGLEAAYEPDFGIARMRLYVGGEPSVNIVIPPDPLMRLGFRAYAGADFEFWLLTISMEYVFVDVEYPKGSGGTVLADQPRDLDRVRLVPVAGTGKLQPVRRDYLRMGREGFALSASVQPVSSGLDGFRALSALPPRNAVGLGTAVALPAPLASGPLPYPASEQVDLALVTNLFPNAAPAMAAHGAELMLLYTGDDGSSNALACTDVRWIRWDGLNWSVPATIHTNTQGEFSPRVAFDGNGDAVALWERVADPNFTNVNVAAMAAEMEIAWARWNHATGLWTPPVALTANSVLDHAPLLCGPMADGSLLATWTHNAANLLMGTNGASSQVWWTRWSPQTSAWSEPEVLLDDVPYRLSQTLAGATNRAIYAWTRDLDGDLTNTLDRQVFARTWNGTAWDAPLPVATNALGESGAHAAVSPTGEVFLVWQQGTNLVWSCDLGATFAEVRRDSASVGFADLALTFGPAGNLVLLWQEMTGAGSDAHYMVFDPVSGLWGRDELLCSDAPLERSFAPVWDAVGNLTVAYSKVQVEKVAKTLALEGGGVVEVTGIPQPGRVDLYVTKRALVPDLALEAGGFTADGGNFLPGDAVTLTAAFRNAGDVAMQDVDVSFYIGDPSAGGTLITNVVLVGWMEAAAIDVATAMWSVPYPATNHTLYAVVNRIGSAGEFDPANNTQALAVGGVNLRPALVRYAAETNRALRIVAEVFNVGAPRAGSSLLALRRSDATGANVTPTVLATVSVPALGPGRLAQVAFDLPAGTQPEGIAYYQIRADDTGVTGDVDTNDNATTFAVNLWIDSDDDGMPDAYERQWAFLSPTDAIDAAGDQDRDGMSNLAEYLAGTNPEDAGSSLTLQSDSGLMTTGVFRVVWRSESNRLYVVEHGTNLLTEALAPVVEHVLATPPTNSYEDTSSTNQTPNFYRVRLE